MGFLTSPATDKTLDLISRGFLTGYELEVKRQEEQAANVVRTQAAQERATMMAAMQEDRQKAQIEMAVLGAEIKAKLARENNTVDTAKDANQKTFSNLQKALEADRRTLAAVENDPKYGSTGVTFWQNQVQRRQDEVNAFAADLSTVNAEYASGGGMRLLVPKYSTPEAVTERATLLSPEAEVVRSLTDDNARLDLEVKKARINSLNAAAARARDRASGGRGNSGGRLLASGVEYVANFEKAKNDVDFATTEYNKLVKDPVWGPMIKAGEPEAIKLRDGALAKITLAKNGLGDAVSSYAKLFKETKNSSVPDEVKGDFEFLYNQYRGGNIDAVMSYDPLGNTNTGAWLRRSKVIETPAPSAQSPRLFRLR